MDVGVSVTSLPFAVAVLVSVLLLTPLVHSLGRRLGLAAINVGFLLMANRRAAVVALAIVLAHWVVLVAVAKLETRLARVAAGAWMALLLLLFVINKRADWGSLLGGGRLRSGLAIIGFSYVFLRAVEQLRWVLTNRKAPHVLDHLCFLIPFHMLAAGPIKAYAEFLNEPAVPPPLGVDQVLAAIERICWGLFKKLILAHFVERLFLTGFSGSLGYSLVEMQFFFLWLYLDFSSYSDIAVGVGRLIGAETPENFNAPYLARNLVDFWDRWHISLSLWIRRNLFTPLQLALVRRWGPEHGILAASCAFTLSFLLCGLWHNISWRYLGWGALHAAGLVVTNIYREALKRRLGSKGVKAYLQRPGVRALAVFATYEYLALSLVLIAKG